MKRLVPLVLSAALILSLLSACGSPDADTTLIPPSDDSGEAASQPAADTQEPSLALPSEEPSPDPSDSSTHHPEESHHAEPSDHPEESHHAEEPTHHGTDTPAPSAKPSDKPAPTPTPKPTPTPAPTPSPTPAPTPTPAPASVDLAAFYDELVFDDADFNASMRLDGEYLDQLYPGLSGIATRQVVVYQPMMSFVVCEIALVEVANSSSVNAVKDIFQARINYQAEDGAFYPAACESWQVNSRIVSHGNYVMMIAYEKCDSVVSQFNALF